MTSRDDAVEVWNSIHANFFPNLRRRRGLLGDGAGNVDVPSKSNWSWIRYDDQQNKVSMVRNLKWWHLAEDTPVWVGKEYPDSGYEEVLGVYYGPYSLSITPGTRDGYAVPAHGSTHHGSTGMDPAPIDLNNIVLGKVTPTDPESLSVDISAFIYSYNLEVKVQNAANLDLSTYVPIVAGHRYVLVYYTPSTESFGSIGSDIYPDPVTPSVPDAISGTIPLAVVEMSFGQSEIDTEDITQYKLLWGVLGGDVGVHTHESDAEGGSSLLDIQELNLSDSVSIFMIGSMLFPTHVYHEISIPTVYTDEWPDLEADLTWISPDPHYGPGQILIIKPADPGLYTVYKINVRHGVGNIWLHDECDILLDKGTDHLILIYDGENWCDLITSACKFGDVEEGNYTEFDADGHMTMNGDAIVWVELEPDIIVEDSTAPPATSSVLASGNIELYHYEAVGSAEILSFVFHMPSGWKEGSVIYPFIEWMPVDASAGDVLFSITYSWTNRGDTFGAPSTITSPLAAPGVAWKPVYDGTAPIDGSGKVAGSTIIASLYRDSSEPVDSYGDSVALLKFGLRIQLDELGSKI